MPSRPDTPPGRAMAAPAFCAARDRRYLLAAAILASALGFIDGTLIAIALPAMRADLDAGLVEAQWINNGYLLPLSALILLGGALGDRFGTARSFAIGIGIFVAASMACALAPTVEMLIAGRVAKGMGAAIMIPGSLALIAKAYPASERGRAIGLWAAASALTTALGPLLGGLALDVGGPAVWRWLFAINLPLGALALWLILTRALNDKADSTQPLDWTGAILITAALGLLAGGLTGRADAAVIGTGMLVLAGFLIWEARTPRPMVPLSLFCDPTFAVANLATGMIYFALTTILFFLPMTMIAGWGTSEGLASVAFAPLSVCIATLSARAGALASTRGPGPLIGAGGGCVAVSFAVMALTAPLQSFWISVLPGTVLMGFGMALVVSPLSTAVMGSVPEERSGAASGINNAVSRIAGMIAVAVMGSLAGQMYVTAGGPDSFGAFSTAPGHADAMTAAFARLAWVTAALTGIGAALAWLRMPRPQSPD